MAELLPDYLIPLWMVFLILGVVLCVSFVAARQIPSRLRRALYVLAMIASGIIIAGAGPMAQYFTETIWEWGSPKWAFLYLWSLERKDVGPYVLSLLHWGILPGSLAASAAILFRDWPRKVIGSSVMASLLYIAGDLEEALRSSSPQPDVSKIININVLGGVVAGLILASLAWTLERVILGQISVSSTLRKHRSKILAGALSCLALPYLIWYFFFDHPSATVWVKLTNWDYLDSSTPGYSLKLPSNGETTLYGKDKWLRATLDNDHPATLAFQSEKPGFRLKTEPRPSRGIDYKKLDELNPRFRKLKPLVQSTSPTLQLTLRGRGEVSLISTTKEPIFFYLALAKFDFTRIFKTPDECLISFFGRPSNTRARLRAEGRFDVYIQKWDLSSSLTIATGSNKLIYREQGGENENFQLQSSSGSATYENLVTNIRASDCAPIVSSLTSSEFLRAHGAEGVVRLGINSYDIGAGSTLLLGNAELGIEHKDGALLVSGTAREVRLNTVPLNESRWGRVSIEMKTTLIATLLGALGASIGLLRQRKSSKQD
ncbi:MAG: hypothetical protein ACJ75H_21645 [Thermoanaerobaculia bacterium]